jgi:hypothetical protein
MGPRIILITFLARKSTRHMPPHAYCGLVHRLLNPLGFAVGQLAHFERNETQGI